MPTLTEDDISNIKLEDPDYKKYITIGIIAVVAIIVIAFVLTAGSIPEEKIETVQLKAMSWLSGKQSVIEDQLKEHRTEDSKISKILSNVNKHCSDDIDKIAVFGSVFTEDFNTTCGEDCLLWKINNKYHIKRTIEIFSWENTYNAENIDPNTCIVNKTPILKNMAMQIKIRKENSEKLLLSWILTQMADSQATGCNAVMDTIDNLKAAELGLEMIDLGAKELQKRVDEKAPAVINESYYQTQSQTYNIIREITQEVEANYNQVFTDLYTKIVKNYDQSIENPFTHQPDIDLSLVFDNEDMQLVQRCEKDVSLAENIAQMFAKDSYNTFLNAYSENQLLQSVPTAIIFTGFEIMKGIDLAA